MGDKITLSLDERTAQGKKVARLRKDGITPGVIYGADAETVSVQAPYNVVEKVVRAAGYHTPVHVTVGGKKRITMIKDVEMDYVKNRIQHVSFHAVKANEPVTAVVPIHMTGEGESPAEKSGLVILQALDKLEVKALPMDLPEALEVSVLGLEAEGDKVTVGDIVLPAGVALVEHDDGRADDEEDEKPQLTDLMIASVWEPAALQAANESAAGDATAEDAENVPVEAGEEPTVAKEQAE